MSVIIKLLSKFDDSGIKKAKSSFGGLGKTIGALGIGIGITQIASGLLDAAKSASADAKATQLLNVQLVKNAGATDQAVIANGHFIETLSLQTGIMDDDLRPAMGKLVRATGSVETAQNLLTLSLDAATVAGKPLDTVAQAMARAFTGNKTALIKLFPALKTSKDLFGDLEKIVGGAAIQQADPFMLLNNSMDILKEKLGVVVLPILTDFIDEISKPGGAIEVVGQFFDDLADPKSDVGKTFVEIKDAVGDAIENIKTFFGFFGGGDAVQGFKNVATALIQALPALLALKGIMMLANSGKAIANLITAMTAIAAGNTNFSSPISKVAKSPIVGAAKVFVPVAITAGTLTTIDAEFSNPAKRNQLAQAAQSKFSGYNPGMDKGLFVGKDGKSSSGQVINNITINNTAVDPKSAVDALGKYLKTNGRLPAELFWNKR